VHHDEAMLIQTAREAAEQLRELFEADVTSRLSTLQQAAADKKS
jgi:hypothetical protein